MIAKPIKIDPHTLSLLFRELSTVRKAGGGEKEAMRRVAHTLRVFYFLEFEADAGGSFYPAEVGGWTVGYVPQGRVGHLRMLQGHQVIVVCYAKKVGKRRMYLAGQI